MQGDRAASTSSYRHRHEHTTAAKPPHRRRYDRITALNAQRGASTGHRGPRRHHRAKERVGRPTAAHPSFARAAPSGGGEDKWKGKGAREGRRKLLVAHGTDAGARVFSG
jgi:hypothetical protein